MTGEWSKAGGTTTIGATIAGHRIGRLLGSGTLGRVFECYTPQEKRVAIKLLRRQHQSLGDALLRDGRQLAQVQSPHVVGVIDVAVFSGAPYVVMEFVDGEDLRTRLTRGPLGSADALEFAHQAADGLRALWAHGIAHGDVRPANMLISGTTLKVVDARLAPVIAGTEGLRGSAEYIAPELLLGTPPDALSDIYSLGVTLYELLAGRPPFHGDTAELFHAHAHTPPPPVPASPSVADLVARMLAKDRSERVKTWSDVQDGIERALAGQAQPAPARPIVPSVDVAFDEESVSDGLFTDVSTSELNLPRTATPLAGQSGAVGKAPAPNPAFSRAPPSGSIPAPVMDLGPARPARAPAPIPVMPVLPVMSGGGEGEHTLVRPMGGEPVPSAEDIGLVLVPVDDDKQG